MARDSIRVGRIIAGGGIVQGIIREVRLGLRLRQAILLRVVRRLARGRRVSVPIAGNTRVRRGASGRHSRLVGRSARKHGRFTIVLVPPGNHVVASLSHAAPISTALHRVSRVWVGRTGVMDPCRIEVLRIITGIVTWHSSRQLLILSGALLGNICLVATGRGLGGGRRVAGLTVVCLITIIRIRHRREPKGSRPGNGQCLKLCKMRLSNSRAGVERDQRGNRSRQRSTRNRNFRPVEMRGARANHELPKSSSARGAFPRNERIWRTE